MSPTPLPSASLRTAPQARVDSVPFPATLVSTGSRTTLPSSTLPPRLTPSGSPRHASPCSPGMHLQVPTSRPLGQPTWQPGGRRTFLRSGLWVRAATMSRLPTSRVYHRATPPSFTPTSPIATDCSSRPPLHPRRMPNGYRSSSALPAPARPPPRPTPAAPWPWAPEGVARTV